MRILYISFFSKPLNSIPSLRTNAFLQYMPELGVEVDVLTRHYDEKYRIGNNFGITFSAVEELKDVDQKVGNIVYTNFDTNSKGIERFNKLPYGLKTVYSFYHKDLYHKGWIDVALQSFEKSLSHNKYDFIVASYSPIAALQLASKLSKKHHIPWIADFRDTYIGIDYETNFSTFYKKHVLNAVIKSASGIVGVCQGIVNQIDKYGTPSIRRIPKAVVNNGVDMAVEPQIDPADKEIADAIVKLKEEHAFLFIHTGTIYEGQDIDFFLDFIQEHNKRKDTKIQLVCLGLTNDCIDFKRLTDKGAIIMGRVKNSTSLFIQKLADALIIPAWYPERYTGFVGKIFEYVHSGNAVFCSPKPPSDLEEFLQNFENVCIVKDQTELEERVEKLMQTRDHRTIENNNSPILFRKYWIQKMADFLFELKGKK